MGVTQTVPVEFKSQYHQKRKERKAIEEQH
jgi:hypothetical protein